MTNEELVLRIYKEPSKSKKFLSVHLGGGKNHK